MVRKALDKWLNKYGVDLSADTAHSLCNSLGLDGEKVDECLGLCYQLEKGEINEADFTGGLSLLTGKKPEEVAGLLGGAETMFFNVPEAREQLINKEFVYTLRLKMRRVGRDVAYYGSFYKKERIGDIWIEFIKEIRDLRELWPYLTDSGFKNMRDWLEAAKGSRFLFKVRLTEER